MDKTENLSEKLFKPQIHVKETSRIIGSLSKAQQQVDNVLDGASEASWYRILRRPQWSWLGLDPIEIERTLARIAASSHHRSFDTKLDTVIGYRPGNWAYEWSQNAASAEKAARAYLEAKKNVKAAHQWLIASSFYSLGAYPYIKGDNLALQAQMLSSKAFHSAIEHLPYKIKTITTKVKGKPLEGILYLPHTNEPLPTVMVSVGFECLQTDLWRLFETYFAPQNIAMLTIDMPSMGLSNHWYLTEDTSCLHQAMLHELKSTPWVDHTRVGCLGFRLGANAAVRLAFLEPNRLKSCVSIGGILHSTLCDSKKLNHLTPMQTDVLSSRIGREVSSSLLTGLQALSLKNQGLLAGRRTPVPLLALGFKGDPLGSESDNQLAASFSKEGKVKCLSGLLLHQTYHKLLTESIDWFTQTL